jgi:leucyl/phenylalanyl-tRNA--protein transferase
VNKPRVEWLSPLDSPHSFPHVESALREPDGLLAAGGDLSGERLLAAYTSGIFPWYEDGQPILWWSPDPRCVLRPEDFRVSRRLRQYQCRSRFEVSFNQAFDRVIRACAGRRRDQQGTWITPGMIAAYEQLHVDGWAHSVEIWAETDLVGGLYGLSIGSVFFGESMFSHRDHASKFAMLALCQVLARSEFVLLDCQVVSPHLIALGATQIPRRDFTAILGTSCATRSQFRKWPPNRLLIAELAGK